MCTENTKDGTEVNPHATHFSDAPCGLIYFHYHLALTRSAWGIPTRCVAIGLKTLNSSSGKQRHTPDTCEDPQTPKITLIVSQPSTMLSFTMGLFSLTLYPKNHPSLFKLAVLAEPVSTSANVEHGLLDDAIGCSRCFGGPSWVGLTCSQIPLHS